MPNPERSTSGSAREAILAEMLRQAALVGVDNVKIEDVLNAARSSPSSLYHHFGSRSGLRAAARSERKRLGILEEDQSLLELPASMSTPEEFIAFMAGQLRRTVTDALAVARRQERLESLTVGLRDPDIDKENRRLLAFMTEAVSVTISGAVERGLCNRHLNVPAYVNFYMSLSMGQLATSTMMDVERWLEVAVPAFLAPLRIPDDAEQ
ncbi:MAG: TetR/AcrR family transcriptional regulator [Ilumatobacteraceae bacterium]